MFDCGYNYNFLVTSEILIFVPVKSATVATPSEPTSKLAKIHRSHHLVFRTRCRIPAGIWIYIHFAKKLCKFNKKSVKMYLTFELKLVEAQPNFEKNKEAFVSGLTLLTIKMKRQKLFCCLSTATPPPHQAIHCWSGLALSNFRLASCKSKEKWRLKMITIQSYLTSFCFCGLPIFSLLSGSSRLDNGPIVAQQFSAETLLNDHELM